jgi:5-keto-L-gluconate epimerase
MLTGKYPQNGCLFPHGVVCALEPLPESKPVVFCGSVAEVAGQARAAGYDAVELHIRNPLQYNGGTIRQVLRENGLSCCAISTGLEHLGNGLSLVSEDAEARSAAIRRLMEHITLAAQLGGLLVIGTIRAQIPDPSRRSQCENWLAEALLSLSASAREQGVHLVVESITRHITNYLNTVPETVDFLRKLAQPNLSLHIDTYSMNVEDADMPAAIRYCGKDIGYVHFSDSNRRYPGAGHIDFKPLLLALAEIGYNGPIGFEYVPWPDPGQSAKRGLDYVKALETCISIESARSVPPRKT